MDSSLSGLLDLIFYKYLAFIEESCQFAAHLEEFDLFFSGARSIGKTKKKKSRGEVFILARQWWGISPRWALTADTILNFTWFDSGSIRPMSMRWCANSPTAETLCLFRLFTRAHKLKLFFLFFCFVNSFSWKRVGISLTPGPEAELQFDWISTLMLFDFALSWNSFQLKHLI